MAIPEKYSHIDFTPPSGVRREADYGLKLRREYGRGGTSVGIARARDLSNGEQLSPSTVRRMKAYFDRHQSDQQGEGFNRGDKGWPSNGYIAAKLWGGFQSGYSWAKKVVEQMNAADDEQRSLRPKGSTFGIKPKVSVVHGPPASGKTTYVNENKGPNDVVFDFDAVMHAISGLPPHHKNENLISYCTDIRRLIIDKSLRSPKVDRTWIIATRADDTLRESLADVPVDYVHVDTPKEECLKRVEADPLRKDVAEETRQVIENYFAETSERSSPVVPNVERRYLGNFSQTEPTNPDDLRVEQRADPATGKPQTYIVGYAARFGKDSLLLGDFVERISPTAFEIVESRKDLDGKPLETRCLFNHSPDHLLGRFPTTMRLAVDEQGLRYECLLPESRSDLKELISRGDLRGSSFSFVVAEGGEKWTTEEGRSIRTVTAIKSLLDCGPVTYPAYDSATVAVAKRSYDSFVAEKRKKSEVAEKADRVREESMRFLAERRNCGTGAGGFQKGNSCGGGGGGGGAANKDDSAWREGAGAGALLGAGFGTLAGAAGTLAGAAIGAVAGATVGLFGKQSQEPLEKAYKSTGTNLAKADKAAKILGKPMVVSSTPDGGIEASGGGVKFTVEKDDWQDEGENAKGTNAHFTQDSGDADPVSFASSAVKAGKALGVNHVSVAVSSDDTKSLSRLQSKGFKVVRAEKGSAAILRKSLSKSSGRRSYDELIAFYESRAEDCGRDEGGKFGGGNKCAGDGKYAEWKKGDHKDKAKEKETQDFIDKAREDQTTSSGKDGGKSDDGGGVQTWSKGDDYPWTSKQVGTDEGYVQGQHPDGSKTEKYPFKGDSAEAYKKVSEEIKRRKGKRSVDHRQVIGDTLQFLKDRMG